MDLSIGEFEDVGEVIKSIMAPDATVVVGTVIKPEMEGISVTIVATGLGSAEGEQPPSAEADQGESFDANNQYQKYERPSLLRRQAGQYQGNAAAARAAATTIKRQQPIVKPSEAQQYVKSR